jgi:hypothetical protein
MDNIFVNIIILPMLSYFQLFYDYFSLIKIISPYIIYDYLWLFSITFGYSKLFLAIPSNSNIWLLVIFLLGLLVVINGYCYLSYWWLLLHITGYSTNGH